MIAYAEATLLESGSRPIADGGRRDHGGKYGECNDREVHVKRVWNEDIDELVCWVERMS